MLTSNDVLDAAHAIRPYLPELLGAEAETVDHALAELLAKAESGEAVDNQILELLAEREPTRDWIRQYLPYEGLYNMKGSYDPLGGSVSPIKANTFVCQVPGCSEIWYRPRAGIEPPRCKEHQIPLVPAKPQTP